VASTTMRAWRVSNGVFDLAEVPMPALAPGHRLVTVLHCGICGSDLAKLSASPIPTPPGNSWIPGHEIVGHTADNDAEDFVAIDPLVPCEDCVACESGRIQLCRDLRRLGWDLPGGFAQYVAVPERNLVHVSQSVDPAVLILADPLAVAIHGVRCGLGAEPARTLAVVGAGTIGICTAAYAASRGHSVTVYSSRRLTGEPLFGYAELKSASIEQQPATRYDAVVDAGRGGDDQPLRRSLGLVRDGGTILVQNAYLPGVRLAEDLRAVFCRSVRIVGSYSFCREYGEGDFVEAVRILTESPAWATELVSGQFDMADLGRLVTGPDEASRLTKYIVSPTAGDWQFCNYHEGRAE
jgi:threonine dehydrogenase-like Zn-dependent dehydrogenase